MKLGRSSVRRLLIVLAVGTTSLFAVAGAMGAGPYADFGADYGTPDNEVTVGSLDTFFSQNKQNEPAVAIDAHMPNVVAAGANDNIDMELCNAGPDNSCPFTTGIGASGISFSFDSGKTWTQPNYTGWTARDCYGVDDPNPVPENYTYTDVCEPHVGPIGTLPWYYESGLVADGDPALAFGPRPGPNGFSWANGARLYYATLASNFSAARSEQTIKGFEAIAVSRTDNPQLAATGGEAGKNAWMRPVIVSRQNAALFSDKEQIWADNAASSPHFGNVYICNVAFRGAAGAEPVFLHRSTDGGETWQQRQLTNAANTGSGAGKSGGRQGCSVRTDSQGVVYVFWIGTLNFQTVQYMARSFDGGVSFERPRAVANVEDCGLFDPATGRFSFDGVAGARTDSFPSVDIANGAPLGNGPNTIVMTWCDGPTTTTGPTEEALVQASVNKGETWSTPVDAAPAGDRPDFPAIAISPDGTDAYITYMNFLQPWQNSALNPPRWMQGVVRHADVSGGQVGAWSDVHRAPVGDARGSSQNNLVAEFLGDYNYAAATNEFAVAVWNDVRQAADCTAVDRYRQDYVNAVTSGSAQPMGRDRDTAGDNVEPAKKPPAPTLPTRPEPNNECPQTPDHAFGNSDIWGLSTLDPTP